MEETEETFCLFSIQLLLDAYVDSGTTHSDSCPRRTFQALRQELGSLRVMQRARSGANARAIMKGKGLETVPGSALWFHMWLRYFRAKVENEMEEGGWQTLMWRVWVLTEWVCCWQQDGASGKADASRVLSRGGNSGPRQAEQGDLRTLMWVVFRCRWKPL